MADTSHHEPSVKADPPPQLTAAIERWRQVLGPERVLTEPHALASYALDTTPIERRIPAVVRPASVAHVQEAVRIAAAHRVPLYPISAGHNWGYGAANPVFDGHVVLDLSDLRRIEVDAELAYAVIEPGVTQGDLHRYLEEHHIPLWIDPTGAGPSASLLGNALERGYGLTPYGDHFAHVCGMEVVLADGQLLRTGLWHREPSPAAHVFRWGIGPWLDGLFTQSNVGIVTRIGLWLMPKPERMEVCYFSARREEAIGPLVHAVRDVLLQRIITSSVNLVHRNRVLTMLQQYPWERMQGRTPLSDEVAAELAREHRVAVWNGVAALYGTAQQVRATRRAIRRRLQGLADRIVFVSDATVRRATRWPTLTRLVTGLEPGRLLRTLNASVGVFSGVPTEASLVTAFWRSKRPMPAGSIHPARERCGLIWFSPVVPMTSTHVQTFRALVAPIFARHRFECCLTLTSVTARAFDCTLPVLYDREDADETQRAAACSRELLEVCGRHGYWPYRIGVQSMEWLTGHPSVFWEVVARLKYALDPEGILSPRRYNRR